MTKPVVAIAGGGTGGHIYPGVAIAKALQNMEPECDVHFVGAVGGLEEKIVPREGFPLHLISIGKMHSSVGIKKQIMTALGLPLAFLQALKLHIKLKPRVVLGVGGYASAPFLFVARLLGTRTVIWEPNAQPGLTNRSLSRIVKEALVVFPEATKQLHSKKIEIIGLPVRSEIESLASRALTAQGSSNIGLGLAPHKKLHVLVFGGSQGARAINQTVLKAVQKGGDWIQKIELIHQTGPYDFEKTEAEYKSLALPQVQVMPYFHDMPDKLLWADVVVCRAGASTVAEIAAAGKPALFVPLPSAADDHQRKNAEALFREGAAEMILQNNFSPEALIAFIENMIQSPEKMMAYGAQVHKFHKAQSAQQIARFLLGHGPSQERSQ